MTSYIKFNCDYQLVYLAQTIITLNSFDNTSISQHFYYFYNFSLKLALLQVCIAYFYFFKIKIFKRFN